MESALLKHERLLHQLIFLLRLVVWSFFVPSIKKKQLLKKRDDEKLFCAEDRSRLFGQFCQVHTHAEYVLIRTPGQIMSRVQTSKIRLKDSRRNCLLDDSIHLSQL